MERKEFITDISIKLKKNSIVDMLLTILSFSNNKHENNKENKEEINKCIIEIINIINSKNILQYLAIFYNNYMKINIEKDFDQFLEEKIKQIRNTIFTDSKNYFYKVYDIKGKVSSNLRRDTFQHLIDEMFYDFIIKDIIMPIDNKIYSNKEQFLSIIADEIRNAFCSILTRHNYLKRIYDEATDWDTYYKESKEYRENRHFWFEELKF